MTALISGTARSWRWTLKLGPPVVRFRLLSTPEASGQRTRGRPPRSAGIEYSHRPGGYRAKRSVASSAVALCPLKKIYLTLVMTIICNLYIQENILRLLKMQCNFNIFTNVKWLCKMWTICYDPFHTNQLLTRISYTLNIIFMISFHTTIEIRVKNDVHSEALQK